MLSFIQASHSCDIHNLLSHSASDDFKLPNSDGIGPVKPLFSIHNCTLRIVSDEINSYCIVINNMNIQFKFIDLPNMTYFQAFKFPNSVGIVPDTAVLLFAPCFPVTEIPPIITQ